MVNYTNDQNLEGSADTSLEIVPFQAEFFRHTETLTRSDRIISPHVSMYISLFDQSPNLHYWRHSLLFYQMKKESDVLFVSL